METNFPSPSIRPDIFCKLPKVELHRHLEGSLRFETVIEIAEQHKQEGLPLPSDLPSLVQITPGDTLNANNFLAKFLTLRDFYLTPEIIQRVAYEAVVDAALDGVEYLELRFTPTTLGRLKKFPLNEVIDWVITNAYKASKEYGIALRFIASVNRHDGVDVAEEVGELAIKNINRGLIGLDLAGAEAQFPAAPFLDLFHKAKLAGLFLTIHAGEWAGAANVRQALSDFHADRIGHGIRVMEDAAVVGLALQQKTVFEVCITSNYQSGVIHSSQEHPLTKMMAAGLKVTLNTDDPSISRIKLSDEYRQASEVFGLSLQELAGRIITAGEAAFLPETERRTLVENLRNKLSHFVTL